ncbi:MAG: OmpA family protein [Mangrovicoccus sp.]|nr:OmpA family protein [Mangrovicoccus sp.]
MRLRAGLWPIMALAALPLWAEPALRLPQGAEQTAQTDDPPGRYGVARGVWADGVLPMEEINGQRQRRAYRFSDRPGLMRDVIATFAQQLRGAGYEILLSCQDYTCGGFDFRHRLAVLPLPGMYVDLGAFRYISAARGTGDDRELLALLASRSNGVVHLQWDQVTGLAVPDEIILTPAPSAPPTEQGVAQSFAERGYMVLEDLRFDVGAATLAEAAYGSLQHLADYLAEHPAARIALVGHTDHTGSLAGNRTVSRQRAQAVADLLMAEHGIAADRMLVEGVGFLAPRADNHSAAGREANRRVTAVLLEGG